MLEQRIGRLDRIGQTATIQIHVPYIPGTESEVLARWYHEGLNAFEKNPHGAGEILRALEKELDGAAPKILRGEAGEDDREIARSAGARWRRNWSAATTGCWS